MTYTKSCPICDEEFSVELDDDTANPDDVAPHLLQLDINEHLVEQHSKRQLLWNGVKLWVRNLVGRGDS
jgi:hypothetical protein